jgi:hypothetical protein
MSTHADHRFSIRVQTDDIAVLYCLRALADYSQETGNTRITWGGTKKEDWERSGRSVVFRFTRPTYRTRFIKEASRVLPAGSWAKVAENDNDPALPRS